MNTIAGLVNLFKESSIPNKRGISNKIKVVTGFLRTLIKQLLHFSRRFISTSPKFPQTQQDVYDFKTGP